MILNIPDEISYESKENMVKFRIENISTGWMRPDDSFIKRIDEDSLNKAFLTEHVKKEIEIKNILDDSIRFLKSQKYKRAIEGFDRVLFYDWQHGEALLNKSYSLKGQKHFVKALRFYKNAIDADGNLRDSEYYRTLLRQANEERDNFPKLKMNIYAGDEYFAGGEFAKAIESYGRALANPSKFKDRILSKLLNKKATALLKSNEFGDALDCFIQSQKAGMNDYAVYGEGICQYHLGLEISDFFKSRLKVDKRKMLKQIQVLNDRGFFSQSLEISDYLYRNHFRVDEFYLELLLARKFTLNRLHMDSNEIDTVIDKFRDNF